MMSRRIWMWSSLLALPLTVAGALYATSPTLGGYVCPVTGETLACEKCCPLNDAKKAAGYVCPITGETLACEKCCPLNDAKKVAAEAAVVCPITGEELACEKCCPLNAK